MIACKHSFTSSDPIVPGLVVLITIFEQLLAGQLMAFSDNSRYAGIRERNCLMFATFALKLESEAGAIHLHMPVAHRRQSESTVFFGYSSLPIRIREVSKSLTTVASTFSRLKFQLRRSRSTCFRIFGNALASESSLSKLASSQKARQSG